MFSISHQSARLKGFRRAFPYGGASACAFARPFECPADGDDDHARFAERAVRIATALCDRRLAGRVFGGCRLDRVAGQGRFGTGFFAHRVADGALRRVNGHGLSCPDRHAGAPVFMKLVKPRGGAIDRAAVWAECAALSLCDHAGIPWWLGIVNERGSYFIVESVLPGSSLSSLLSSGRVFAQDEIASVGRALIDIAEHMALRGVVHNDIRPANVLIEARRPTDIRLGLVDFGLAEFFDRGIDEAQAIRVAGADIAGIAEVVIHMLYSDRMRVRAGLSADVPWFDALLLSPVQRRLLLDMFEGRVDSYDRLRERFDGAFGASSPRIPYFAKVPRAAS